MALIAVQLAFRGVIPGADSPTQLREYDSFYLFNLLTSFVGNNNTFLVTLIFFPTINLVFFEFQMRVQLQHYYDPYTGNLMEGDEITHFHKYKMTIFTGQLVFFLAHTWYMQKDMITQAIANHMIRRQQTQLVSFLGDQEDPTFVINKHGEMQHSNTAALKLY